MPESTRTKIRGSVILGVPLLLFAAPAIAAGVTGDTGISLPSNIDPDAVGYLICVYILRDMHLRTMRTMESLLLKPKEEE